MVVGGSNQDAVSLLNQQRRYRVRLGGTELFGRPIVWSAVTGVVESLKGWWDLPPAVGRVDQLEQQDGGSPEDAYYAPRTLVLKGSFSGKDTILVREAFERFTGSLSIRHLTPLVVEEPGALRHVLVRLEGNQDLSWKGFGTARFDLQLIAPDYRRFSGDGSGPSYTVEVALPSEQGGLAPPFAPPISVDATVVSGAVDVTNAGDAPPRVVAQIKGPVHQPIIATTDGQLMMFDLSISAEDFLEVDFDRHSIRLNGIASRRGALRGRWITFDSTSTTLRFGSSAYNPDARMSVSWSDAYK